MRLAALGFGFLCLAILCGIMGFIDAVNGKPWFDIIVMNLITLATFGAAFQLLSKGENYDENHK